MIWKKDKGQGTLQLFNWTKSSKRCVVNTCKKKAKIQKRKRTLAFKRNKKQEKERGTMVVAQERNRNAWGCLLLLKGELHTNGHYKTFILKTTIFFTILTIFCTRHVCCWLNKCDTKKEFMVNKENIKKLLAIMNQTTASQILKDTFGCNLSLSWLLRNHKWWQYCKRIEESQMWIKETFYEILIDDETNVILQSHFKGERVREVR